MVNSSKSIGAIACDESSVSGSTPITIATSSGSPARSGRLVEHVRVARQQQRAEPVRAAQLQAVDRDVLDAGRRIACDQEARRQQERTK